MTREVKEAKDYYIYDDDPYFAKTYSGANCHLITLQNLIYKGGLDSGLFSGKGSLEFPDGTIYEGMFEKHMMIGNGTYTFPNADQFFGELLNGKRHGKGVFVSRTDSYTYYGEWQQGKMSGKGVAEYKSGAKYVGEWQNGMRNGFGLLVYITGNYYLGYWKDDKKEGYGEMNWREFDQENRLYKDLEVYLGFWRDNKQHGFGRHIWFEQQEMLEPDNTPKPFVVRREYSNRYEGMFRNGMKNGLGIFFYSDGSTYQGEWQDDLKHGFAYFTDYMGATKELIFGDNKQFKRIDEERDNQYFHTVEAFHTVTASMGVSHSLKEPKNTIFSS